MTKQTGKPLRLLSWNMHFRSTTSWAYVLGMKNEFDIALLQEAPHPPSNALELVASPQLCVTEWRIPSPVDIARPFRSTIVRLSDVSIEPIEFASSATSVSRTLTQSHEGQFAVAEVSRPNDDPLTVVSLYGLWEYPPDGRESLADASLHRAISDLTPLFDGRPLVIAGDMNIWRGYGSWRARYQTVFDRLAAHNVTCVGPFRRDNVAPLAKCPCKSAECSHVATYFHHRKRDGVPYQTDFVFASKKLAPHVSVEVLDDEVTWSHSDHVPIRIEVG